MPTLLSVLSVASIDRAAAFRTFSRAVGAAAILGVLPVESFAGPQPVFSGSCVVGTSTAPMPAAAQPTSLTRSDNYFSVDGTPKFLISFSYFGAKYDSSTRVREVMRGFRCKGFNAVRVFAEWWYSPSYCNGAFDPFPLINPDTNPSVVGFGGWLKLYTILAIAKEEGLVVDLAFASEVVQGRSFTRYRLGVQTVAQYIADNGWGHVMIDVQNEYNVPVGGCKPDASQALGEMTQLVNAARTGNANRVVVASWSNHNGAQVTNAGTLGLSALAVHECRTYGPAEPTCFAYPGYWYAPTFAQVYVPTLNANNIRYPIFMQEPDRYVHPSWGTYGCFGTCVLTAQNIIDSAVGAVLYGAAGWTFHTESLFFPHLPEVRRWDGSSQQPSGVQQGVLDGLWATMQFAQVCRGRLTPTTPYDWMPSVSSWPGCPV